MILSGGINRILSIVISSHPLSIEDMGRRKLIAVFFFMIIPADIIYGILHFRKGLYDIAAIDIILALIMACFIILLRYIKNAKPLYRIVLLLYSLTLIYFIQKGIVQGYASIWAMFHPLFAFFLLGKKEGFIWTVPFTIIMISLFINPYSLLSGFVYNPLFTSRFLSTYVMIFLFTYSYESVRERYKLAMENEQAKLKIEKDKLAGANLHLKDEMKMKEQAEIELRRHRDHLEDIVAERTDELKRNNRQLEASEKRYRLMADNVNDMIWSSDMNLNFSFISPSVYRIYGYTVDEAQKVPLRKYHTPESYSKLMKCYHEEVEPEKINAPNPPKYIVIQLDQIKKDGTVFTAEIKVSIIRDENGNAVGIVGITRDISDRIAMEQEREKIKEQLAQSQKMEALGTLVGGLAHDFNNFLSGIIGSFDLISRVLKNEDLKKKEYIEKYLNLGMESSKRSAGLINQLLILSKKHEVRLSPLDITDSINHIYELCRNSFPKSIELRFDIEEAPLVIMGDTVQIEQVLLNLCINASHAMTSMRPEGSKQGGTLTLKAEKIRSDNIMKDNYPDADAAADQWIVIRISDTGVGIDPQTRQRIFEPFFSTKNKNESSGLGLAITYNIIKRHGGIINVYSEPGAGSCFSIYFPAFIDDNTVRNDSQNNEVMKGSGTVLIIDDEPVILKIAGGFLEQCGYNIITAEGADKGIEIYKREYPGISAVLIDLSMPDKSGLEVFQELQKINAGVKAILSSGMLDSESKDAALKAGIKETVNKPYLAAELSKKMKTAIGGD